MTSNPPPPSDPAASVEALTALALDLLHRAHDADNPPPLEIDDDGWCHGDGMTTLPTPAIRQQQTLAPTLEHVEGIAWHWTDTRGCGAMNLAKRLQSGDRAASWHVVIGADGAMVQSVSAKKGAWHVGSDSAALFTRVPATGEWMPLTLAQRGKLRGFGGNSWLFGVELENVGEVRLVDGKWCGWPFAFGTKWGAPAVVPADEVSQSDVGHGHHRFSDAQVSAARRLAGALVRRYGLRREACEWGHCQIDPERRTDPGPLWLGADERGAVPARGLGVSGHLRMILDAIFA